MPTAYGAAVDLGANSGRGGTGGMDKIFVEFIPAARAVLPLLVGRPGRD